MSEIKTEGVIAESEVFHASPKGPECQSSAMMTDTPVEA